MTPRLAEIMAAMVTAKLAADEARVAERGTVASRSARAHHGRVAPAGRQGRTRP